MFRNRRNNVLWFDSRRLFSAKKIVLTQKKWRINGMKKVGIFMADGCEEIEGLTVVDIVRRAKLEMTTISITDKKEVTSSHNVTFLTDALASEVDFDGFDAIVLPGGMPGNMNNIMKQLTLISIILMIPTLIASFYGMNVPNALQDNPFGLTIIVITSLLISSCGVLLCRYRKWL